MTFRSHPSKAKKNLDSSLSRGTTSPQEENRGETYKTLHKEYIKEYTCKKEELTSGTQNNNNKTNNRETTSKGIVEKQKGHATQKDEIDASYQSLTSTSQRVLKQTVLASQKAYQTIKKQRKKGK
ncbi:MAG: hypothetical protein EP343_21050 [Deltaproteobacteria bacterium]|nr:MAG: hypothetical protein EP343_21050 [Deltaproteobacteria bacterium]